MLLVLVVSAIRIVVYARYRRLDPEEPLSPFWGSFAIGTSLISGGLWGGFALFVFPDVEPSYELYMVILISLVPVAPVAALATYLPSFYAYYIPASVPFLGILAADGSRAAWTSAVLLTILMIATLQFARQFHNSLTEAHNLRLQSHEDAARLAKSLKDRTQFMIDANHDLRQPLQALELSLGTHGASDFMPTPEQLGTARTATSMLNDYLERLREVTQFERPDRPLVRQAIALDPVLRRLTDLFRPIAAEKDMTIRYVTTRLAVETDLAALDIVLRNFLGNAVAHSTKGSRVVVGCRRQGDQVAICIADNGPGIPEEDQARIFEDFVQLQNPVRDRVKGIGLGLSIAQRGAKHAGLRLELDSAEGRGSIFKVIALRAVSPLTDPGADAAVGLPKFKAPLQLLVVDGEAHIRDGLARLLESWGHGVRLAARSVEALDLVKTGFTPDAVLLDYRLESDCTGFDLWRSLEDTTQKDLPCLIITGDVSRDLAQHAEDEGCFYLLKPVDFDALAAALRTVTPAA